MNVGAWLDGLGLGQYARAFAENDIDGAALRVLTADDLRELGVRSLGHRRKLLAAIAKSATGRSSLIVPFQLTRAGSGTTSCPHSGHRRDPSSPGRSPLKS